MEERLLGRRGYDCGSWFDLHPGNLSWLGGWRISRGIVLPATV